MSAERPVVGVRLSPQALRKVAVAAAREERSRSDMLRRLLSMGLLQWEKANGVIPDE